MSEETIVGGQTGSATIRVLSASAQRAALIACAEQYCAGVSVSVHFSWATSGAVIQRVEAGEAYAMIAASREALEGLAVKGRVTAPIHVTGVSRIALGMRKGEAPPDISTPEKFRDALLAAKAFARSDPAGGGTAGNFLVTILDKVGVLDATKDRSILRVGGYNVMKEVAEGRADFGLTQSTEIVAVDGVEISAWLPPELQMETVYAIAPSASAKSETAQGFFNFVVGPDGKAIYRNAGFADL